MEHVGWYISGLNGHGLLLRDLGNLAVISFAAFVCYTPSRLIMLHFLVHYFTVPLGCCSLCWLSVYGHFHLHLFDFRVIVYFVCVYAVCFFICFFYAYMTTYLTFLRLPDRDDGGRSKGDEGRADSWEAKSMRMAGSANRFYRDFF